MSSVSSESNNLAAMLKVERLGTKYGGWFVPLGCIDSSLVFAGAGEDVSFDFALLPGQVPRFISSTLRRGQLRTLTSSVSKLSKIPK